MITATGIRHPGDRFDLGQRVRYHHRVSEMRLLPIAKGLPSHWKPTGPGRCDPFDLIWSEWSEERKEFRAPRGVNKTLAIWPEEGGGIVIALIRKGIGYSVQHSTSFNGESYEPEPGYFDVGLWVWLYVVKHSLRGLDDLALVPMDALTAEGDTDGIGHSRVRKDRAAAAS